ncbi:hypothetical protein BRC86_00005, partial [Halobacteriales archaeon QS_3_64_16]
MGRLPRLHRCRGPWDRPARPAALQRRRAPGGGSGSIRHTPLGSPVSKRIRGPHRFRHQRSSARACSRQCYRMAPRRTPERS